jgi:hypothetical protein
MCGYHESVAKQKWKEMIPRTKASLAGALEILSGRTTTLHLGDRDILEQRRWDSLSQQERDAEIAEGEADAKRAEKAAIIAAANADLEADSEEAPEWWASLSKEERAAGIARAFASASIAAAIAEADAQGETLDAAAILSAFVEARARVEPEEGQRWWDSLSSEERMLNILTEFWMEKEWEKQDEHEE